jgi:16S rRNA (guanine527-N7)-methyltransferase
VDTNQIAGLLLPFISLNERQLRQTSEYIDLLLKWNSRINLTAVRIPEEIVIRHFGESFFVGAKLMARREWRSVIDLGSGAGFPGLPLALLAPQASTTLIESNGKKAVFLNEVIRVVDIRNAAVFSGRAEEYRDQAELVIMRAVEKFDSSMVLASRLIGPGGRLALMVGGGQVEKAIAIGQQLAWDAPIQLPAGSSRVLMVGTRLMKVVPERYVDCKEG